MPDVSASSVLRTQPRCSRTLARASPRTRRSSRLGSAPSSALRARASLRAGRPSRPKRPATTAASTWVEPVEEVGAESVQRQELLVGLGVEVGGIVLVAVDVAVGVGPALVARPSAVVGVGDEPGIE